MIHTLRRDAVTPSSLPFSSLNFSAKTGTRRFSLRGLGSAMSIEASIEKTIRESLAEILTNTGTNTGGDKLRENLLQCARLQQVRAKSCSRPLM